MGLAQYAIVAVADHWSVLHDGDVHGEYATKKSAFEIGSLGSVLGDQAGP